MSFKHPASTKIIIALILLFLQGCSNNSSMFSKDKIPLVYRVDVQQGNVINQDMLAKLKLGMDKKKVRFIMGTPLISDTFHSNRWDYVYTFKKGRDVREQRRITLFFKDGLLAQVDGNINPASGVIETMPKNVESVDVPPAEPHGIFSSVKEKLTFDKDQPKMSKKTVKKVDPELTTEDSSKTSAETNEEEKGFFEKIWSRDEDE